MSSTGVPELPLGYWQPAIHFVSYVAPGLVGLCVLALAAVRRQRPPLEPDKVIRGRCRWLRLERPGDGLFAAEELGPVKSSLLSAAILALLLIPWLAFLTAIVLGLIMSAVESWNADDGVPYLQYGLSLLMNKATSVAPTTPAGRIWSMFIALFAYIFMSVILGFASMLRLVSTTILAFPEYPITVFMCLILLVVPLVMILLALVMSMVLVFSESIQFFDAFLTALDFMTTGGNLSLGVSGTQFSWPMGILVNQIGIMSVFALTGTVIGILGGHPTVTRIMTFLEGVDEMEEGERDDSASSTKDLGDGQAPQPAQSSLIPAGTQKSKMWVASKTSQESETIDLRKRLEAMEARAVAAEAKVCELQSQLSQAERQQPSATTVEEQQPALNSDAPPS